MILRSETAGFDHDSYLDPAGRVFMHEGRVYRAFFPEHSGFFADFLASQHTRELIDKGMLVHTEEDDGISVDGYGLVVRHERVRFPSYCSEWPAGMLKDAAALTLDLCLEMLHRNILLQDASPFNVFFERGRPVFIDMGSFQPASNDYLWAPYQQFCDYFLHPLYLHASRYSDIALRLLKEHNTGVSSEDVSNILGLSDKLGAPGYAGRIALPGLLSKVMRKHIQSGKLSSMSSNMGSRLDLSSMRRRFFMNLRRQIGRIRFRDNSGHWVDYYDQTGKEYLALKESTVSAVLKRLSPASVLDVGCNLGRFSEYACNAGASVVSFDTDHAAVQKVYEMARQKDLDILPLVMSVLSPTPASGWRGRQYKSAQDRLACDTVMALAVIHHMVFTEGQDFERSVLALKDFSLGRLLVEFVSIDDEMVKIIKRRPGVDYSWYREEEFLRVLSRHFRDVEVVKRLSDTRTLILASGHSGAGNGP